MRHWRWLAAGALALSLIQAGPAAAMNSGGGEASLADIEALIADKDFAAAVEKLNGYTEASPWDPDGFNLLGYSQRQLGAYGEAEKAYDRALRLDPEHKGALEYLGELYVKTGRAGEAKATLERLKAVCGTDCAEYRKLEAFIARPDN